MDARPDGTNLAESAHWRTFGLADAKLRAANSAYRRGDFQALRALRNKAPDQAGRPGSSTPDPTAGRIDAAEAARIGLINRMVPNEDVDDHLLDLPRTIADTAPFAVAGSKLTISELLTDPADRDMAAVASLWWD